MRSLAIQAKTWIRSFRKLDPVPDLVCFKKPIRIRIKIPQCAYIASPMKVDNEGPKIYQKSVLHLLKRT